MISTHTKDFCEKHGLHLPDFNFLNLPDFYNMFQQVAKVEKGFLQLSYTLYSQIWLNILVWLHEEIWGGGGQKQNGSL